MNMELFLIGLGMLIVAFLVAFDEASALRKVVFCVIGGLTLGVIVITPIGVMAGIIAPGTANPLWKDMIFGGIFGGIIGATFGTIGGLVVFALSVLVRYVAKQMNPAGQD
jgi:hypothetical protein